MSGIRDFNVQGLQREGNFSSRSAQVEGRLQSFLSAECIYYVLVYVRRVARAQARGRCMTQALPRACVRCSPRARYDGTNGSEALYPPTLSMDDFTASSSSAGQEAASDAAAAAAADLLAVERAQIHYAGVSRG